MSSITGEIAKFESQVAAGSDTQMNNVPSHAHAGPGHIDPAGVPAGDTGRHSHSVNSIEVPNTDKKIVDIHGQQPPHHGGLHVDLPFEHGNTQPFPVLHEGHVPIDSAGPDPSVGLPAQLGPPSLGDVLDPTHSVGIQDGVHSHVPVAAPVIPAKPMLDGVMSIEDGIGHGPPSHAGVHVDPPNHHGNNLPVPVVHRETDPGQFDTHRDPPGIHNNNIHVPMAHIPPGQGLPPGHVGPHGLGDVHVDAPGVHGNSLPVPVVHRTPAVGLPMIPDHTGVHAGPAINPGHSGVHIDAPGMHGNDLHVPVVHRTPAVGPLVNPGPMGAHIGPSVNTGHTGVHVDAPGMHGNNLPIPVVHRPTAHIGVHVDAPGIHGNTLSVPVVHRPSAMGHPQSPGHTDVHVGAFVSAGHSGVHVDAPGMHGNDLPVPVVHRPTAIGPPVPPLNPGHTGVHVDTPGLHGNDLPVPVVHRPAVIGPPIMPVHNDVHVGHSMPIPAVGGIGPPMVPNIQTGVHVDVPGIHGNNLPVPVVHRPTAIGPPSAHDMGVPSLHKPSGIGPPLIPDHKVDIHNMHGKDHTGIHADPPGIHGNGFQLPPGLTMEEALASGAFPELMHPNKALPPKPKLPMPKPVVPIGIPKQSMNSPIVPDKRDIMREQRRQERKRQRKILRQQQRDSLLADVLDKSKALSGKHNHIDIPPKPEPKPPPKNKGVIIIRREPAINGIIGSILGSLMAPRPVGPRPFAVRIGPPLPPPPPQGDPLQRVASTLMGILASSVG